MPGFLDVAGYSGETEIPVAPGYWVRVKNCLTSDEYAHVQQLLGSGRAVIRLNGAPSAVNVDIPAAMREMLFRAVTAWNLDDPDGTPWPLEPEKARRASIAEKVPYPVLQQVYEKCDELNSPRKGPEAAQFPDEGVGGGEDGDGAPAGDGPVPA